MILIQQIKSDSKFKMKKIKFKMEKIKFKMKKIKFKMKKPGEGWKK